MLIYHEDCLSLPEQVQKNKKDIEAITKFLPEHGFFKKDIKITTTGWEYDFSTGLSKWSTELEYITEDAVPLLTPRSEAVLSPLFLDGYYKIRKIISKNGGIEIYADDNPKIDLLCSLYYNSNVTPI